MKKRSKICKLLKTMPVPGLKQYIINMYVYNIDKNISHQSNFGNKEQHYQTRFVTGDLFGSASICCIKIPKVIYILM